jgi:hypothetical protein
VLHPGGRHDADQQFELGRDLQLEAREQAQEVQEAQEEAQEAQAARPGPPDQPTATPERRFHGLTLSER